MIIACEKWRKDFGVEELSKWVPLLGGVRGSELIVPFRHFDFKEKDVVDKYYPQYYHKTDIVRHLSHIMALVKIDMDLFLFRMVVQYTSSVSDSSISLSYTRPQQKTVSCSVSSGSTRSSSTNVCPLAQKPQGTPSKRHALSLTSKTSLSATSTMSRTILAGHPSLAKISTQSAWANFTSLMLPICSRPFGL